MTDNNSRALDSFATTHLGGSCRTGGAGGRSDGGCPGNGAARGGAIGTGSPSTSTCSLSRSASVRMDEVASVLATA